MLSYILITEPSLVKAKIKEMTQERAQFLNKQFYSGQKGNHARNWVYLPVGSNEVYECPYCGNTDVDWGRPETVDSGVIRRHVCELCNHTFTEVFVFSHLAMPD